MGGAGWKGSLVLVLGVALFGCADIEGTDTAGAANDEGVAPVTSALYEEVFEIEEGPGDPPRCRVRLNWCNRPGPDERGECQAFNCDIGRAFEACTTLAWDVCGTFVPPYIIW